jgi:hypothetical protein
MAKKNSCRGQPSEDAPVVEGRSQASERLDETAANSDEDREHRGEPSQSEAKRIDLQQQKLMMDKRLQEQLGRQLRAIFADVAEEPVPERFIRLLEALEAKEKRR